MFDNFVLKINAGVRVNNVGLAIFLSKDYFSSSPDMPKMLPPLTLGMNISRVVTISREVKKLKSISRELENSREMLKCLLIYEYSVRIPGSTVYLCIRIASSKVNNWCS